MKYKYFFYIVPVIMAFLFSCEKEIKFSGDEVKTKMVLNGLLTPDSIVKINLTESRFFLEDDGIFKKINNATVELWKDGSKIENLSNTGEGYYEGTYIPKADDNLRITAFCEGFDPIECSTEIATPTPIISADTINLKEEKEYYYYYSEDGTFYVDSSYYSSSIIFDMDITFKDPKDIPNYYVINVYMKYYLSNGMNLSFPVSYVSDDMVFQTGNEMGFLEDNDYLRSTEFSDELLDGKEYKLKIKAKKWGSITIGKNPYETDYDSTEVVEKEIIVELQSLSSSYYLFRKTREANSSGNMGYFSEPVQIYTNVKGGIGILGSYSSSIYTIPLK